MMWFVWKNVINRKLRSFLSSLGIAIGVFAIFSLISLGKGMYKGVEQMIKEIGADKVIIFPTGLFTKDDIDFLEKQSAVKIVLPIKATTSFFRMGNYYVYGLNIKKAKEFFEGTGYNIETGRIFKKSGEAIVGSKIPDALDVDIGDKIDIGGREFRIVGILETIGSRFDDYSIIIPEKDFDEIFQSPGYQMVLLKVYGDPEKVADDLSEKLKRKRGKEDFEILTQESILERLRNIFSLITAFFLSTASISLVVGTIGVMNSIYTSVHERIKIIGLLRAVGATRKQIMLIFLLESVVISIIGCLMGLFFGNLFVLLSERYIRKYFFSPYRSYIGVDSHMICFLISVIVGVFAGFLPSRSASKIEPAVALRYE